MTINAQMHMLTAFNEVFLTSLMNMTGKIVGLILLVALLWIQQTCILTTWSSD